MQTSTHNRNSSVEVDGARSESGSLQRGLALSEALLIAQRPLTATELSEATGTPLSTVHRLLQSLVQLGYVCRDGTSRRYLAGPKTLLPMSLYHPLNVLRREAREPLRLLRDQFRQTTTLVAFLGYERIVVELAIENDAISPYHATHLKTPLHGAASGKVLLASLSPKERAQLLGTEPLTRRTPHTITDTSALEMEIQKVRSQGFAVVSDENHVGLTAAAAPIQAPPGRAIGCFLVSGLTANFDRESAYAAGPVLKMSADLFAMGSSAVRAVATSLGKESIDSFSGFAD